MITHWSPAVREQAQALFDEGWKKKDIAIELGVPVKTIQRWMPSLADRPRHSDEARRRAVEMFRSGASLSQIARELGAHKTTVDYWLRDIRQKQVRIPHSPETVRLALDRLDGGEELQVVARELGVPPGTIHNWVARRDSDVMVDRLYGGDRRARYAIRRPALALALSGAWR